MFKILINIALIFIGLGTSAYANDFELLSGDFEQTISIETSGDVSELSASHHNFFDLQTEDYSVVSNADKEPAPENENSGQLFNCNGSFSVLETNQYVGAVLIACRYSYLRKLLFPFHSFW
ncbi:hypothetical protein [Winogradskyella vidalii]|uniref:hypothetical protein n=1 Tax=Winogradskyella vidalii TaxID=2615024 RepID=UPI0015C9A1A1|nr:hypothetical protein [Winogradskyella vidalii]